MAQLRDPFAALLADPNLTRCARGHDHRHYPVKGSFHERAGPGKQPLFTFHCPECGAVTARTARPENWRQHATIAAAMSRGNVLPCARCFPRLSKAFDAILKAEGR